MISQGDVDMRGWADSTPPALLPDAEQSAHPLALVDEANL
jgi:hypothetical protein